MYEGLNEVKCLVLFTRDFSCLLLNWTFLMFTISRENTVKCLEGFSRNPHRLLELSILICSCEIVNKMTLKLSHEFRNYWQ